MREFNHSDLEKGTGRTRHREEDFQAGLPKAVPFGPKMESQLQIRSQGLEPLRTRGSAHKVLWGHKDGHHHTSPHH